MSRRTSDPNDGVFDFCQVLDEIEEGGDTSAPDANSDVESYYSDAGRRSGDTDDDDSAPSSVIEPYDYGVLESFSSGEDDDDSTLESSNSNDDHSDDVNDNNYDDNDNDDDDEENNDDGDEDDISGSSDDLPADYFIGGNVPDEHVPFCGDIFSPIDNFSPPTSFGTQLRLQDLFNRNKGSLKMYDDVIKIINAYTSASDFSPFDSLLPRAAFISRMEEIFEKQNFKPTYGSVRLHDGSNATVPVFDIKNMILSILHDPLLMVADNFAEGLDVFTGKVDEDCEANNRYGEYHTGDAWNLAMERFGGTDGKYMPFGMIIFGDKSKTDQHGSLSVTPITFTATFFNKRVRNNPDCWRPITYLPNLAYGNAGGKPTQKVQDEHNCLAYAFKSLVDVSEQGGICTEVMGRRVIVKPFIHIFIGQHNVSLQSERGTCYSCYYVWHILLMAS